MSELTQAAPELDRVLVLDTTLRDGEQAPGFSMSAEAKLKVAHALNALGVDIIEAGFAAASPGDEDAIRRISGEIESAVICSLARAGEADILAAHRALSHNRRRRVHIVMGTSPIHRAAKFRMSREEVMSTILRAIEFARGYFEDIEISAEDAIRTEVDFLFEVLEAAAEAGATTLNVPDTVGYSTAHEVHALFTDLKARIGRRFPALVLSTHCHNDLGMAVANTVAAVKAGARQIEVTVNGIGERAGNCALEEVVMALRVRRDMLGVETRIDTTRLVGVSRLLSEITETPVLRNKAIVGINAFAHEAGLHQDGVMADARTYEIMRPQDVGFASNCFVLGKHSGRRAVAKRAAALGFELSEVALAAVFAGFKRRADVIGEIDDAELRAIIATALSRTTGEHRAAC